MTRHAHETTRPTPPPATEPPAGAPTAPDQPTAEMTRRRFFGVAGGALGSGLLPVVASDLRTPLAVPSSPSGIVQTPEAPPFLAALPVWPAGREREMNLTVRFSARFGHEESDGDVLVRLTGSTVYRLTLNGDFLGYGPARGPHGYFRVDSIPVPADRLADHNVLEIEVAGYNVNSYYLLNQPSFLQAEVVRGGEVLCATGHPELAFSARVAFERLQRVQRYSFQRPFVEAYRLGSPSPESAAGADSAPAALGEGPARSLLSRNVPLPAYYLRSPQAIVAEGEIETRPVAAPWRDRSLNNIGPTFLGFPEEELELVLSTEAQALGNRTFRPVVDRRRPDGPLHLAADSFSLLDFGTNFSGFIGLELVVSRPARVYLLFDEILTGGDVDFLRLGCVNAIAMDLQPGTFRFESFEPYTLRYLKLIARDAELGVSAVTLREYGAPDVDEAQFAASDPRLNRLFEAGRETYRQNAVDVFSDCPSRERAGWLCDSYFTARTAQALSRSSSLERNLFENYALPETFEFLPAGMLPMCYPADHNDGVFIPNWSLWFVLQLEEYATRTGDRETVDRLRRRVENLFAYFERFRNADGLLEKLESWVFVEWSAANGFVQDVSYPSNMLFAAALSAAGSLYGRSDWERDAETIRDTIRQQSFDGEFFVDNAVRKDGRLERTRNRSEVCQYFAFHFGVATPATHPALWRTLRDAFGPQRQTAGAYPEIHPANAFVGNVLRLELLSREGLGRQILDESVAYQLYMADRTGTLWEHQEPGASCNHGFASHVVHVLYRDVLGCYRVDEPNRLLEVRFTDVDLVWCRGRIPVRDGFISIDWRKAENRLLHRIEAPAGYRVDVENLTGFALEAL